MRASAPTIGGSSHRFLESDAARCETGGIPGSIDARETLSCLYGLLMNHSGLSPSAEVSLNGWEGRKRSSLSRSPDSPHGPFGFRYCFWVGVPVLDLCPGAVDAGQPAQTNTKQRSFSEESKRSGTVAGIDRVPAQKTNRRIPGAKPSGRWSSRRLATQRRLRVGRTSGVREAGPLQH